MADNNKKNGESSEGVEPLYVVQLYFGKHIPIIMPSSPNRTIMVTYVIGPVSPANNE